MPHFDVVMSSHLFVTCPHVLPSLPTYLLLVYLLRDHAHLLIPCLPISPLPPTYLLLICLFHHLTYLLVTCLPTSPLLPTYFAIAIHSCITYMFALSTHHHCLPASPSLPCLLTICPPCSCLL